MTESKQNAEGLVNVRTSSYIREAFKVHYVVFGEEILIIDFFLLCLIY